jgi:hypothetical protein
MIVCIRRPIRFQMQTNGEFCDVELNFYIVLLNGRIQNLKGANFLKIVIRVDHFLKLNYLRYGTKDCLSDRYESVINN